jgi:hypothetical protein
MGANVDSVRGIYAAFERGDVAGVLGAFDASIEWREAESFFYADRNPYIGPAAVAEGVFQRIVTDVESFAAAPATFIDGGDTVVVEGRYTGRMKSTGKSVDAQFAHVWSLRGGKVVRFQQYTDTSQWSRAFQS